MIAISHQDADQDVPGQAEIKLPPAFMRLRAMKYIFETVLPRGFCQAKYHKILYPK
jgi:hypothetical protein